MIMPDRYILLRLTVNVMCVLAVLIQLTFILRQAVPKKSTAQYPNHLGGWGGVEKEGEWGNNFFLLCFVDSFSRGFIYPTLLNMDASEIDLRDTEFPLDIKICAEPGFNETAIEEVGYDRSPWTYFNGVSRFNSSIVGWAGHTNDFGVKGSVEGVFKKVRNHILEEVISSIWMDFDTEDSSYLSSKHVTLGRVNYPHNCYRLDLSSVTQMRHESIKTLGISFKSGNLEKVQISLQGITLATNRDIFDNSFYTRGDKITVTPGRINKYAVEISKNVYLEEDKSKKCADYPNSEFDTYMECDDRYMKNICQRFQLAPIWLLDDFSHVTSKAVVNDSGT